MERNRQKKFGTFVCQCGCKQTFTGEYTTRAPMYLDRKHRLAKLAKNKAEARAKKTKQLFAEYKARRAAFTKLGFSGPLAARLAKAVKDKDFVKVCQAIQAPKLEAKND